MTLSNDAPVMLIAGGTGSIGREVAAQALAAGWAVVIHGRCRDKLATTVQELKGGETTCDIAGIAVDIRDDDAARLLVEQALAVYGRLNAVVDCLVTGPVSGGITGSFATTDPQAYAELMQLSVVYLQQLAFAALPALEASSGCLIALVSDAGVYSAPRQALIGAARSAAIGFIRNLARDIAREGVRAHCVSPSFVLHTESARRLATGSHSRLQKASQRAGLGLPTPEDIAPLVLFLCSDQACRMTGQVIHINGGLNT